MNILLNFYSDVSWDGVERGKNLANLLLSQDTFLLPQKFNQGLPCRFEFNPDNLEKFYELWSSRVIVFGRKSPYPIEIYIDGRYKLIDLFNRFDLFLDQRFLQKDVNLDVLLQFAKQIYRWGDISYGYICHFNEWLGKRESYDLRYSLPGVFWANFFGPAYVNLIGKEKFLTAPVYFKEELENGGFLLLTTPSPFDYSLPETSIIAHNLIKHLGQDSFFDKTQPNKIYYVPDFNLEQPLPSVTNTNYNPISAATPNSDLSAAIPDPQQFITDVNKLAEALIGRFEGELDYSYKSLNELDKFIMRKSYKNPEPWKTKAGQKLFQEIVAYYGEVVRREKKGYWGLIDAESRRQIDIKTTELIETNPKTFEPVILENNEKQSIYHYPFISVLRYWIEREPSTKLGDRS